MNDATAPVPPHDPNGVARAAHTTVTDTAAEAASVKSAVPSAAGATGIVAIAQTLDDPWRAVFSIVGPWVVVGWRWLVPTVEPVLHLWAIQWLSKTVDTLSISDNDKQQLQQRVQNARLRIMERMARRLDDGN